MAQIVGVLLAAGAGRRFGSDKLLHPLADGTPLAVAAAHTLVAACPQSLAVLRPAQQELAALLQEAGLAVVFSDEAAGGMGHSLAAGVAAAPHAGGWLVALADMPFGQAATFLRVRAALAGGALLAAPLCDGRRGHPVGFAACWREELLQLEGDEGARRLVQRERAQLQLLACEDRGVLRDIDTRADLAAPGAVGCG